MTGQVAEIEVVEIAGAPPVAFKLKLPMISHDVARARTKLSRLAIDGTVRVLDTALSYATIDIGLDGSIEGAVFDLLIGDQSVTMAFNVDLPTLLDSLDRLVGGLTVLEPEVLAIIVEHMMTGEFEALEQHFGAAVHVSSVCLKRSFTPEQALVALRFSSGADATFDGYLWSRDTDRLVDLFARNYARRTVLAPADMKIETAILGPVAQIDRAMLDKIAVGDVLVVSPVWAARDQMIHLVVKNEHLVPLQAVPGGVVAGEVETTVTALRDRLKNGDTMKESCKDGAGFYADPQTIVTVEIKRLEMTLSQLQEIQKGDIFDFDIDAIETVRVCSDGSPIAEGRLVQMDDTVGVQITKRL